MADQSLLEGNSSRPLGVVRGAVLSSDEPPQEPRPAGSIYLLRRQDDDEDEGAIVGAFGSRAAAEEMLAWRVRESRRTWLCHPWFDLPRLTALPPALFRDVVQDLGLEPPPVSWIGSAAGWACWWAVKEPTMTEWQRQQFVAALERLPGLRLVEVPLAE